MVFPLQRLVQFLPVYPAYCFDGYDNVYVTDALEFVSVDGQFGTKINGMYLLLVVCPLYDD